VSIESPQLAPPAGPIGQFLAELLAASAEEPPLAAEVAAETVAELVAGADPLADDDLQRALYVAYELHYRGFPDVDPGWEWSPVLLAARAVLVQAFLEALEAAVPRQGEADPERVGELLFEIEAAAEGPSLSRWVESRASLEQFRELAVHRSLYQLKEADPQSWAIPRLTGTVKSALLEVQVDEYGGGRPERMHSRLWAKTMRSLGLDDRENAYLDRVPGVTLATVNLGSALGLQRARRGALVGSLAMFEMTSALPNRRYGNALRRLGFDEEATDFHDEHVEADSVHENIAAYDLAGGLARAEPELTADILFGAGALLFLEDRFARHLLGAWERGETSLPQPL
jgi:Iron-containing redox enzyme